MKKLLFIAFLLCYNSMYAQFKIVLQTNRELKANRVEFTKNSMLLDDYYKINSKIFELDKGLIKSVTDSSGKIYDFKPMVSSKNEVEKFRNNYNPNQETISDSTKVKEIPKDLTIRKELSEDSINVLIKTYLGLPEKDNNIFIEEVTSLEENAKKDKIYLALMEWISKTFNSSKAVIDFQDKEAGKIICKDWAESPPTKGFLGTDVLLIDFTINFTIKDNKYRVQIYNLSAKEKHNESVGMTVIRALGSSPSLSSDDIRSININRINHEYVNSTPNGVYRTKYAQKVVVRSFIVLKGLTESIKEYINKSIKEQGDCKLNCVKVKL